jgi:endonuclease/exonuclease/phosphatase family metal-dependent hydrolase
MASGVRASARSIASALALVACSCARHDHPGGDRFVPFAEIQGELQPELQNGAPPAAAPTGRLRVVTYNVHYGEDVAGLTAAFRDVPSLAAADVVFLEEVDAHPAEGASRAGRLATALGMNHAFAPAWAYPDGGTHGLAVLSRYPITSAGVLDLPYFELGTASERRIALRVTLQIGDREVAAIVVHLDTRINVNDRLEQLSSAVKLADPSCVFGGDFNTLPFVWAGRTLPLLPQDAVAPVDVAAAVDEFMVSQGFTAPTAKSGDTSNNALANFKLDSIYLREYAATGAGVERSVTVSDHFPVWTDVAWP